MGFFKVLVENWGMAISGAGIGHSFRRGVLWGKVGNSIDAFDRDGWMRMTSEELRRASNNLEFPLNS